ncbi:MAG: OsmC family protein [Micrococcales bacterium]|nr:OsmC family protein [Micrococcales bacterium]
MSTASHAEVTRPDPLADAAGTRLWVERVGSRRWVGHSSRGATVRIGPVGTDGAFSPAELLKIALAGCAGLTADAPLERRIGPDGPATVTVDGSFDPEEKRYTTLTDRLTVDLSGLDEAARQRLFASLHRAVEGHCVVARTLDAGASTTFTVVGEPEREHAP